MTDAPEDIEIQRADFKKFMDDNKLSVKGWARDSGVSPGLIRNYLRGRSQTLTARSLRRLASGVGLTLADMLASMGAHRARADAGGTPPVATTEALMGMLQEVVGRLDKIEQQLDLIQVNEDRRTDHTTTGGEHRERRRSSNVLLSRSRPQPIGDLAKDKRTGN
jgi:transcriptional regulator with XRE-family HTH domain